MILQIPRARCSQDHQGTSDPEVFQTTEKFSPRLELKPKMQVPAEFHPLPRLRSNPDLDFLGSRLRQGASPWERNKNS